MMKVETTINEIEKVKDFLEYHAPVLKAGNHGSLTSVDISAFRSTCIFLNEDAFDRVVKNPQVVMDYGCDPLGVEVTLHSNKTMEYSFMWNDMEIMCLKDLDLSKLTSQQSEASP